MLASLTPLVFLTALMPGFELPTAIWQVAPPVIAKYDGELLDMKVTKTRAVLLVPGLLLHPLRPDKAAKPEMHDWTLPKADLVVALSHDFDVFAFGYAQTMPVDMVASTVGFTSTIEKLKRAGYREIVLIGHSAGGIIARQYIERFPKGGVNKVIQIGSPNFGSELANINLNVLKTQIPFIRSLAPKIRNDVMVKSIPTTVDFCCVACKVPRLQGDTMVSLESQWPPELQVQGIPVTLVSVSHFEAMKSPHSIQAITELAREKLVRWKPEQVEQGKSVLFSKEADQAAIKRPDGKERPILQLVRRKLIPDSNAKMQAPVAPLMPPETKPPGPPR